MVAQFDTWRFGLQVALATKLPRQLRAEANPSNDKHSALCLTGYSFHLSARGAQSRDARDVFLLLDSMDSPRTRMAQACTKLKQGACSCLPIQWTCTSSLLKVTPLSIPAKAVLSNKETSDPQRQIVSGICRLRYTEPATRSPTAESSTGWSLKTGRCCRRMLAAAPQAARSCTSSSMAFRALCVSSTARRDLREQRSELSCCGLFAVSPLCGRVSSMRFLHRLEAKYARVMSLADLAR